MPDIVKIKGFFVQNLIGKGSYGTVYSCRTFATNKQYAAKVVDFCQDNRLRWQAENEIEILKELTNHDHIVHIHTSIREVHRNIIILEHLSQTTFLEGIVGWPYFCEYDAKSVIKQLLSALQYIHSKRIVHRDLRPDNILWSQNTPFHSTHAPPQVKIIDFNLARKIPENNNFVNVRPQGDSSYMSPECLKEPSILSFSCDVWSIGVLLYTIFAGYPPFMDFNYNHLLLNIIEGNFALPDKYWSHVNPHGKDFMMKMLVNDYTERWSAKELLAHTWLTTTEIECCSLWPGQRRLKEFLNYLEDIKKSANHRKFMLTVKERKAFVPDDKMIATNTVNNTLVIRMLGGEVERFQE